MPRGMFKSGRLRKIFVRTPGSRTTVHYRARKPSKAICGNCKTQLAGVPRERPAHLKKIPKSSKKMRKLLDGRGY